MISDNNTNLNLSYHPPNPCLLLLPGSFILSPPPPFRSPYPSIYIQLTHTHTQISSDSTGRPVQTRRFLLLVAWLNHEQFSHATLLQSIIGPKDYLKAGAPTQKPISETGVTLSFLMNYIFHCTVTWKSETHHPQQYTQLLPLLSLTNTYICACTHTRTHARTHTHTHTTYAYNTHTHTYIYICMHTHTHARTHTHTPTPHTHITHTHTHTTQYLNITLDMDQTPDLQLCVAAFHGKTQ